MAEVLAASVALAGSWAAGWLVRRRWSGRVLAHPGPRSSHVTPTTRLGGVAVAVGLWGGFLAGWPPGRLLSGVAAASVFAGAVGLAEDLRGVPVAQRLAVQVVAAAIAMALIGGGWLVWLAGGLGIVAYVNAYNFMDGIDGLAGAQLAVAGAAWLVAGGLESAPAAKVAGAVALGCALGFLVHNRPPARVFMGDLGSYAAGGWLAAGAIAGIRAGVAPVAMLAPLALFAFDTSLTMARRLRRGENVLQAHRSHLYQRLVRAGWSHARATSVIAGLLAAVSGAGLLAIGGAAGAAAGAVLAAAGLAGYAIVVRRAAG